MGAGQKPTKLSKSALSKMEEAKTRAIGTRTLLPAPPVPTGTEAPSSHTQRAESQRCVPGPTNSVIRRPQTPHRSGSSPSLASCTLQVFPDAQSTWPPRAAFADEADSTRGPLQKHESVPGSGFPTPHTARGPSAKCSPPPAATEAVTLAAHHSPQSHCTDPGPFAWQRVLKSTFWLGMRPLSAPSTPTALQAAHLTLFQDLPGPSSTLDLTPDSRMTECSPPSRTDSQASVPGLTLVSSPVYHPALPRKQQWVSRT